MSTIHLHQTTTSTPEQYVAGLTDCGPGRSKRMTSWGSSPRASARLAIAQSCSDWLSLVRDEDSRLDRLSQLWLGESWESMCNLKSRRYRPIA